MKKENSDKIVNLINHLQNSYDDNRKWWPRYIYHTTSIVNAVNVLETGRLLSRNRAIELQALKKDIADENVITNTDAKWKDYVRFYLRPKTPTLYVNEGVKPDANIRNNAHCPVPVALLFHSIDMLTRQDAIYSNGNLGSSSVSIGDTAEFFEGLPFEQIYHEGGTGYDPSIIFHRNAEVIFKDEVSLNDLYYVCCRSEAEKQTLISLLPPRTYEKVKNRIVVITRTYLFNERWNFVREVNWTGDKIFVRFNEEAVIRGPFKIGFYFKTDDGREVSKELADYHLKKDLTIPLNSYANTSLTFALYLNDHLIYRNHFIHWDELPF